jgi:hypothetical protein
LGIVPITDGDTCLFGAIDIDKHESPEDVDFAALAAKIREYRLPLVMCRTKRGGAHLYLFGSDYLNARQVRRILASWRDVLQIPYKTEIFPKQDSLTTASGERALGNWINLCYFDCENSLRYGFDDSGEPTSFELFIRLAQNKRISAEDLNELFQREHLEAPPCIQK